MRKPREGLQNLAGDPPINVDQGDGRSPDLIPAEVHLADVDSMRGQRAAHVSDDSWFILVVDEKDIPLGDGLGDEFVDPHETRLILTKESTGDRVAGPFTLSLDNEQGSIVLRFVAF